MEKNLREVIQKDVLATNGKYTIQSILDAADRTAAKEKAQDKILWIMSDNQHQRKAVVLTEAQEVLDRDYYAALNQQLCPDKKKGAQRSGES